MIALGAERLAPTRPDWTELTCMDERPPGWYRDPDNAGQHRYWDGQEWTLTPTDRAAGTEEHQQD